MRNHPSSGSEQQSPNRDADFMPAALQVLERPPAPLARIIIFTILFMGCLILAWACLAHIDIVATGTGVVVVRDRVKVIQAPAQGIITAINVRDGQEVWTGDPLVRLDPTEVQADLDRLSREYRRNRLALMRIRALLANDPDLFIPGDEDEQDDIILQRHLMDQSLQTRAVEDRTLAEQEKRIQAQMDASRVKLQWLEQSLPLAEKLLRQKKKLYTEQALSEEEFLQARMEVNEQRKNLDTEKKLFQELAIALSRARDERALAAERYRQALLEEQAQLSRHHDEVRQQIVKAKKQLTDHELRAPLHGIVQQLAVNTVGGVVTAAQDLLVIVPLDKGLEIEARIPDREIGFIHAGQPVSVKVMAFPFTRYGALTGITEWVGRDAIMDRDRGPVYPVRIRLTSDQLPNTVNGRRGKIVPGMRVITDIQVGKRRVIDYFLGPILRYRDTSLREM